jgi:hypothetical protein
LLLLADPKDQLEVVQALLLRDVVETLQKLKGEG